MIEADLYAALNEPLNGLLYPLRVPEGVNPIRAVVYYRTDTSTDAYQTQEGLKGLMPTFRLDCLARNHAEALDLAHTVCRSIPPKWVLVNLTDIFEAESGWFRRVLDFQVSEEVPV